MRSCLEGEGRGGGIGSWGGCGDGNGSRYPPILRSLELEKRRGRQTGGKQVVDLNNNNFPVRECVARTSAAGAESYVYTVQYKYIHTHIYMYAA